MDLSQNVFNVIIKEEVAFEQVDDFKDQLGRIKHECDSFVESGDAQGLDRRLLINKENDNCVDASFKKSLEREAMENVETSFKNKINVEEQCKRKKSVIPRKKCARKKNKHTCPICHMNVVHLRNHLLTHTKETPYVCTICEQAFTHKISLTTHSFSHTGERPYECSFCEKSYFRAHELKVHLKIHSGQKDFKCSVCSMEFTTRALLMSHVKTHYDQRDYKCDVCKKEFKRKQHLMNHSLIHIGDKSHACAVCGKKFLRKYHLQRHVKRHE